MEWQPIQTAPRDSSDVLLFADDGDGESEIRIAFFAEVGIWLDSACLDEIFNATHWMPLPSPPVDA